MKKIDVFSKGKIELMNLLSNCELNDIQIYEIKESQVNSKSLSNKLSFKGEVERYIIQEKTRRNQELF